MLRKEMILKFKIPTKILILIIFVLGILAGVFFDNIFFRQDKKPSQFNESRLSGYKFINPLLDCDAAPDKYQELKPFKYKVDNIENQYIKDNKATHISVYFRDLNNGPWFGINEKEQFTPASLLKVPLMIAYLKEAEKDPPALQKTYKYDKSYEDEASPNIKPSHSAEKGKIYTVDDLLTLMIAYSDNNAKNILFNNINQNHLEKTYIDLGIKIPDVQTPEDYMSVKTYASFFRILYNASYLNKELSEKALELLIKADFNQGIDAGVPPNIQVANKFGERGYDNNKQKQLHDCGIVYYPNHPYLICVMTRGYDFNTLIGIIKNISSIIYNEVNSQYKK